MSVRINLTLEANEMFLSLHMIFSLERAAVVWAVIERISVFDPSLEMIAPRYLFSTSPSLLPFILISLWKPFWFFVITFVLSGPISILYLVVVVSSRRSARTPASSYFSSFTTMSSAKQKLVISRPPMLILPSSSSNASHMILYRKMLKRVCESRQPSRTPTVALNHSPVLPLNSTALWALSYRFSMARMMLALMLYFLIVAHRASCDTLSKAVLKSMKTVEILLMLQVFLSEDPGIEYLFCGAPFCSETCLLCNDFFCLGLESICSTLL